MFAVAADGESERKIPVEVRKLESIGQVELGRLLRRHSLITPAVPELQALPFHLDLDPVKLAVFHPGMGNVTQKVVGTAVQISRPNGIDELVLVGEKETSRVLRQGGQEFLGGFRVTNVVVRAVLEGNQHQTPRVDAVDRHLVAIGPVDGGAETPGCRWRPCCRF